MKQLFLFVLAIFSLTASAQGLLNRNLCNRPNRLFQKYQPLVELMPFTNAVAKAKAGDGAGLFALAIYVSQGKEVQTNGKLAYKYLCAAADAGDANAIFVKHLLEEMETENGYDRAKNLRSYIGWCTFDCTNRFCEGRIDVGQRDVAEKLLAQYRADFERGVAAATNEIARIEVEIKCSEKYKEQKRIADEQKKKSEEKRKRNAEILASEIGDKVVSEEQVRPRLLGGHQTLYSRRRQERQQMQEESKEQLLVEQIPFAEAVAKAKAGDGAGYYAVALHYALGNEIAVNNEIAAKYLAKAVEVQYPIAVFVDAMVAEERLTTGRMALLGSIPPKISDYTGGASVKDFNASNQALSSFTNAADVAAVKARYETAIRLGVSVATNELARFEKRVEVIQAETKKQLVEQLAENNKKALENNERFTMDRARNELHFKNAQLANDLLGESDELKKQEKLHDEWRDKWTDPNTGITWTYTIKNVEVCVEGADLARGSLIIPSLIGGHPVTSIGKNVFGGCSGLTSVTIPSSVTSIGEGAFSRCSGLTSMTIPSSVTNIGAWAFLRCSGLTSMTIPSSVTNIGAWAFECCRGLTSVRIPSSVVSIGNDAFLNCCELTHVCVDEGDMARVKSLYKWEKNITFVESHAK